LVEDAFGRQALALLRVLDTACTNADDLAATIEHFDTHPDAEIITSLPGLGSLTGARVMAEIGDDRSCFTHARDLKAYARSAPVTRPVGKPHRDPPSSKEPTPGRRRLRLGLFCPDHLTGARTHYDRCNTTGDRHTAAKRNLFNRLLGCLRHCLQARQHYNEQIAFPTHTIPTNAAA
jgi:hypothetical protein